MNILEYTVEELIDPTGILEGRRFEFFLYIDIDQEDELFSEHGTGLRVLYVELESEKRIAAYHFFERNTDKHLDFELEEDEREAVLAFCTEHTAE